MSWRVIQITKPAKLAVKNRQLCIEAENETEVNVPMEDISVIIIESRQVTFSSYFLSEVAENNAVLISCDETHMPSGVFFPFLNHSRFSETAWCQTEVSEPLKKRIWQETVKRKILNQSLVLKVLKRENADILKELAKRVLSGDAKNTEAYAANIYWKSLFEDFCRSDENNIINSALNYGYAVIRGCMARYIASCGLISCFGVHHANKLNQFNLADDMMEPYRPFLDYLVFGLNLKNIGINELNRETKVALTGILLKECIINDEEIGLMKSMEITAFSLAKTMRTKEMKYLSLPVFKET